MEHRKAVNQVATLSNGQGWLILSGSQDGTMRLWVAIFES